MMMMMTTTTTMMINQIKITTEKGEGWGRVCRQHSKQAASKLEESTMDGKWLGGIMIQY